MHMPKTPTIPPSVPWKLRRMLACQQVSKNTLKRTASYVLADRAYDAEHAKWKAREREDDESN